MSMNERTVTQLLHDLRGGDQFAVSELVPRIYGSLRKLAGQMMRRERVDHTLQATAIVNECYMDLVDMQVDWQDRAHFFAIAARQMRRILVDYARANRCQKRGGDQMQLTMDEIRFGANEIDPDIVDLDQALRDLAKFDERKSQIVELLFFGGLTYTEAAEVLGISEATVDRDLRLAKAWLSRELRQAHIS
jgi:RNA polymerase sigma factor (TIGR02999 family)